MVVKTSTSPLPVTPSGPGAFLILNLLTLPCSWTRRNTHVPDVVVVQVFLDALFVFALGHVDVFLQGSLCLLISLLISWLEGSLPLSQQGMHLAVNPRFLVWEHFNSLCWCYTLKAGVDVGQHSSRCDSPSRPLLQISLSLWSQNNPAGLRWLLQSIPKLLLMMDFDCRLLM